MSTSSTDTQFLAKLKEELDIYRNFSTIADKLDRDGYLGYLVQSIDTVFLNEINFALGGGLNRSAQDQDEGEELGGAEAGRDKHLHIQGEH